MPPPCLWCGITANTNAVIDVYGGEDRGKQRCEESHVLGLMGIASPVAAHVAAVDYAGEDGLVSDYASTLSLAEDLGVGTHGQNRWIPDPDRGPRPETGWRHSRKLGHPHIYDGVRVGRDTTRVIDVLDKDGLTRTYETIRNCSRFRVRRLGSSRAPEPCPERRDDGCGSHRESCGPPFHSHL
jgi:hypothetical protein